MSLLDYRLEITQERKLPLMPDGWWRYVFCTNIDGFDFRSESPKQYGLYHDIMLNCVSQIAYQMVQAGLPDGTIHVRESRYDAALSLPPAQRCYYHRSFSPVSKLALYHQMPHIEHNSARYRFNANTRNHVLTSELIRDLERWLKEGDEGFLDYATSYYAWDSMWFALERDMPGSSSEIIRRRNRHYYAHLSNDCSAISFMLRWRGDGSMLGKAIDWM